MIDNARGNQPFYIWNGVYDSFLSAAADTTGPGFAGDIYRSRALAAANECLAALHAGKPIPQFHKQRATFLPCTVAMMLSRTEKLRILDFGGGLGVGYMTLIESIPDYLQTIDYRIVEVPEVSEAGRALLGAKVGYLSDFPVSECFDLVYAASSLQYVEHWREVVEKFAALTPGYILLSDVFAGAIRSFVTLQSYYGSRIPHWFLNLQELLDMFSRNGYALLMKSYATSRRLNVEDEVPMDNFPEALRLSQTLHLLFEKRARPEVEQR